MSEKCENKKECSKMPYMWGGCYPTYPMPEWMWGAQNMDCMWQNMPRRCPYCGSFIPMGGCMPYTNTSFPESD